MTRVERECVHLWQAITHYTTPEQLTTLCPASQTDTNLQAGTRYVSETRRNRRLVGRREGGNVGRREGEE